MLEATAELPMLALILTVHALPIPIGSRGPARGFTFAGTTMRPRATSPRTTPGGRAGGGVWVGGGRPPFAPPFPPPPPPASQEAKMNAPLGLMPAAVRCQPYPFAGITQVRFLRSPRPVGASQPGPPRWARGPRAPAAAFDSRSG